MLSLKRSMLISVEGIDGSGKSTLVQALKTNLEGLQLPLVVTKEPGGTALGKQLRTLVQERTTPLCPQAEFLLFATDRAQHFNELIIPALEQGKLIISDRMADSSLVYQGYGRGLDKDFIKMVNTWAMNNIVPDLTFYVRISPEIAYQRLIARKETLTAFEQEKREFFEKLAKGFDTLYANRPDVIILDGTKDAQSIATKATEDIINFLKLREITTLP